RMPRGGWDTVAAAREWKVLEADGVTFADFARVADFAPGSRRPLASRIRRSAVETTPDGIRIEMELPRGAYATAIVREIVKDAGKSPS
ncbi:MAG TPA: tRNA pseudouridine(13) synthase TruD, partial [Labilithrix sp.]|nr:tRNA pseudouridine(13) synthase TruD [Labilithrix sp.]